MQTGFVHLLTEVGGEFSHLYEMSGDVRGLGESSSETIGAGGVGGRPGGHDGCRRSLHAASALLYQTAHL